MSPSSYFAPRKALILLLGLTMSLAVAKLGPLPQCGTTCANTAATALGCSGLADDACLCAHPGFAKGADSCVQSVCRSQADRKASSDAFDAFAASCGNGTVTVTTTQSGSASKSASASASSGSNSSHSGSSTKPSSAPTTTQSSTKTTGTVTTSTQTTPTTVAGSVSPTVTSGSITTTFTPLVPLLPPTSASGTAVVMQTVIIPGPSGSPISAAYSVHVSSLWSLGALLMGLAGVTLF